MSIKISAIFLMSVLVLGLASYPTSITNIDNDAVNQGEFQISLVEVAFAQTDDESDDEDDVDVEESEEEDKDDEETNENETDEEQDAHKAIVDAEEEINKAQEKMTEAKEKGKVTSASELALKEAQDKLEEAKQNLELGFYEKAEELAEEAEDLASDARMSLLGKNIEDVEEEEEETEIEVEVENGIAKIEVEFNGQELKFEFELTSTNSEDIREEIENEILARTDLTLKQIGNLEIEFEEEAVEEEEIEIEVEIENGKAKIKIELDDEKSRFVLDTTDESKIISLIEEETGLTESEIMEIWDFEVEEEDEEIDEEEKREKVMEKMTEHKLEAKENAEDAILKLQQKIEQLEQRLQTLLEKFETGEYFGPIPEPDPVTTSYGITFDGSATLLDDDSVVTDLEGEIFLETQITRHDASKFRITGGEILIGDTFYDFVIGKARVSSSGTSGEKDSMIILGQVMDDDGNVNTIKIFVKSASPLTGDFSLEPVDLEIKMPQSKIAKKWGLSASGQLSLLKV
ncbi:MAG: hypothetical protein ACT4N1_03500 [Nitrososphaerota archaeon]